MGSYNETCGITQLPILYQDPVRIFLIGDHVPLNYSFSYSTGMFMPYGIPLKGIYNGAGLISNIEETVSSNITLNILKEEIIENHGRSCYKFNLKDSDWYSIIEWMICEELIIAWGFPEGSRKKFLEIQKQFKGNDIKNEEEKFTYEAKKRHSYLQTIYHMMVHEDIYQSMIDINFRDKMLNDTLIFLEEYDKTKNSFFAIDNVFRKLGYTNFFVELFSGNNFGLIRKYLYKIENGMSDDDLKNLVYDLSDFYTFSVAMGKMRKLWLPQSGKGSQDINHELYIKLAQNIIKHAEKAEEKFND